MLTQNVLASGFAKAFARSYIESLVSSGIDIKSHSWYCIWHTGKAGIKMVALNESIIARITIQIKTSHSCTSIRLFCSSVEGSLSNS